MNVPVIADTSALVSVASVTDHNHSAAILYSQSLGKTNRPLVIPAEVFTETVNVVGRKIDQKIAVAVGEELLQSKAYLIVDTNAEIRGLAFEKFRSQKAQPLKSAKASFTDCLVMAFADFYETRDIFGFDAVFLKSGYNIKHPILKS